MAEEFEAHARELKAAGDKAFQGEDYASAAQLYTQAIELNPDDHVFYSNRSACYMKLDSVSKALRDAERCVELAPTWSKGYNRLGVAQQALRRFDAAADSFKKGLELDSTNQALWSALRLCQEAQETEKKQRFAAAALERAKEEERLRELDEAKKRAAQAKGQDDLLSAFLSDVAAPTPTAEPEPELDEDALLSSFLSEVSAPPPPPKAAAAPKGPDPDEEQRLTSDKYTNQQLGSSAEQIARLTAKNCEWRNLNPFTVLQLGIDATAEDIKNRYRKLSARVHPDKNLEEPSAREAFEFVKAAYQKLSDEDARKVVVMNIEYIHSEVQKERRRQLTKGAKEADLGSEEEEVERQTMKHFADIELNRRRSEQVQRSHNTRDKMREADEEEKAHKAHVFEKEWGETTRREKRVGNWREFQEDPEKAKKAKIKTFKEETRADSKHGVVEETAWRSKWK